MAERPGFYFDKDGVKKAVFEFEWYPGFSVAQKQRSIGSLHNAILQRFPGFIPLEVSTKSTDPLGKKLSAFHLKIGEFFLENIFQSSKVFENGGPYTDLLFVSPKEAKRDQRLKESGQIIAFRYLDSEWPLIPRTVFYDYLYYCAVKSALSAEELNEFRKYSFFTDIEFNPNKSLNTQARSAALVRLVLEMYGGLPDIKERDEFIRFHKAFVKG